MAIVEDDVRNESEEENEIEVVLDEYGGEQDSDDSDDDDDAIDEALERKVAQLENRIKIDAYAYDDHIELVNALWALSDLDRWRTAFERVTNLMALKPADWLLRLRTEISLSHSPEAREKIGELFQKAVEDCYSIEILSEWCSWSLGEESEGEACARSHLKRVVECAGADPLSGKLFWDALFEYEKSKLETLSRETDSDKAEYEKQRERVCRCLEEIVSRPLLRGNEAWPLYEVYAIPTPSYGPEYVARTKKDHELAMEYVQKITPFEDRLLTVESPEEKLKVYEEYIETLKELLNDAKYGKRDSEATLKVIYDRATSECPSLALLLEYAKHVDSCHSTSTYRSVLTSCARRWPRTHHFWTLLMQQAERDGKSIEEVHASFEVALLRGMETFKEGELLWLSYIEYKRRQTDFSKEEEVTRLRSTFRLGWDSLATVYGEMANDCEVPLYWARLEYKRMNAPKEGREVFEEIFRYGENITMSKYWEALIRLEMSRTPPISENKLRDLFRRALRSVVDYPPAVVALWTDYERDYGKLDTLVECTDTCERKLKEWREYYKSMKEKMTGKKQFPNKNKNKQDNKKFDKKNKHDSNSAKNDGNKKHDDQSKIKGKRKVDNTDNDSEVKRVKKEYMEVDVPEQDSNKGVKRSHDEEDEGVEMKRVKTENEDARAISREACTLFVSNLEFKVNEQHLRDNLSQYGDIVSLRVKSGVKAFGGSICYCQYKNPESVEEALKHDRSPLDGRPMFFSRYSAKKTKPQFKYATSKENNKLFVKNIPYTHCSKEALTAIFEPHGKLCDIRIVTQKDGRPKGLAYVDYADEESAAKAIESTNGLLVGDRKLEVAISAPPPKAEPPHTLGLPKRDAGGGMRRTQLSSFIPSVLQKATTSKAADTANGDKKPKSNSDFRTLLLGTKST